MMISRDDEVGACLESTLQNPIIGIVLEDGEASLRFNQFRAPADNRQRLADIIIFPEKLVF